MKTEIEELAIEAENVPLCINMKRGGQEVRPAPFAYASDLKQVIFHLLEEKAR